MEHDDENRFNLVCIQNGATFLLTRIYLFVTIYSGRNDTFKPVLIILGTFGLLLSILFFINA